MEAYADYLRLKAKVDVAKERYRKALTKMERGEAEWSKARRWPEERLGPLGRYRDVRDAPPHQGQGMVG
ncbi:hypothetical protein ABIA45_003951 [Bradyrhizobium sp. USDA 336]